MSRPQFPSAMLDVRPWLDPTLDRYGSDPRSEYVERFWLPVLGPSCTWLLRHIVARFDDMPDGFELDLADTAHALGLGFKSGPNSPLARALVRCCQFGLARSCDDETLAVRRKIPPLSRGQVLHLPDRLRHDHETWELGRGGIDTQLRRRARSLALSMLELGEDAEATHAQLQKLHFEPDVCDDALGWARTAHDRARRAELTGDAA